MALPFACARYLRPAGLASLRDPSRHAGGRSLAGEVEFGLAAFGDRTIGLAVLFRVENERAALAAVDPADADRAVAIALDRSALGHLVVILDIADG